MSVIVSMFLCICLGWLKWLVSVCMLVSSMNSLVLFCKCIWFCSDLVRCLRCSVLVGWFLVRMWGWVGVVVGVGVVMVGIFRLMKGNRKRLCWKWVWVWFDG